MRYAKKTFGFVATITIAFAACACPVGAAPASAPATAPALDGARLWEGRFSQCSYNAVSSVLRHFYGPPGTVKDRNAFEQSVFAGPLTAAGYGPYYGWGPWTGYMVESGKMVWNGRPITGLKSERFSLRPAQDPTQEQKHFVIRYAAGEREQLRDKLLGELHKGPVVLWTPYAGVMDASDPHAHPWHHVTRKDDQTDLVPFGPFTHSVTLFLQPDGRILVTDCSVRNGVYSTDPDTIVSTSAAMTAFVRRKGEGQKSMLDRGFTGIKDDMYNVVFYAADERAK